jgi:dTDP-4-amino-4,6-dideoxygalactose transaminase
VLGTWFTSVLEESVAPVHGDYVDGSCPVAEMMAQHLVNLPTHQRVRDVHVRAIMSAFRDVVPLGGRFASTK